MLHVAKHMLARLAYSSLSSLSLASFQAKEYIILLPHHMHPTIGESSSFRVLNRLRFKSLRGASICCILSSIMQGLNSYNLAFS